MQNLQKCWKHEQNSSCVAIDSLGIFLELHGLQLGIIEGFAGIPWPDEVASIYKNVKLSFFLGKQDTWKSAFSRVELRYGHQTILSYH